MLLTLFGVPGKLKKLLDRLTVARAAKLDNLDALISTRAAASTAVSNAILTPARAAKLDNLDAAISGLPAGAIKSIQTGFVNNVQGSLGAGEDIFYYDLPPITAVNTSKSRAFFSGGTGENNLSVGFYHYTSSVLDTGFAFIKFTSSTQVRLHYPRNGMTRFMGTWTVVEYY